MNVPSNPDFQYTPEPTSEEFENNSQEGQGTVIIVQQNVVKTVEEHLANILSRSFNLGILKVYRHKVSSEHRVAKAIEKYSSMFADDEEAMKLLNGMTVIAEDELRLIDGTIVKLGYPKIKADNELAFERIVKGIEGKDARAVYLKGNFEKLLATMKRKGFRIAGNEGDIDGEIARQEQKRIFDMIVKERTSNYSTIIIDILGRAFSGYRRTTGTFYKEGEVEYFWSCSPTTGGGGAYCSYLSYDKDHAKFVHHSRRYGHGVLFFKDNQTNQSTL